MNESFWIAMLGIFAVALFVLLSGAIAWLLAQHTSSVRQSEERYALAMEAAGDGHTDWNLQTGEHYISPRLLQICGYAPGTTFRDRDEWVRRFPFHPEDRPKWEQAVAAHMAGRDSHFKMELRIVVDGEVRWTVFHFLSTRDAAGTPIRWTGSIGDITEHKRTEEALRESQKRYELAMDASDEGVWDWTPTSDKLYLSPRFIELFGFAPGTTFAGRAAMFRAVPMLPEDRAAVNRTIAEHFAGKTARLDFEFRILVGGAVRWIHARGLATRDSMGELVRWNGAVSDVTERKRAEETLRASEARKSAMFETALDCIVSIDHEGRVVEFNPAAERTFGYRRAEALGKELAELIIPPRLRDQHRQGLARYLKGGEGPMLDRRTEMPAVRADGSEFPVELAVTRIATEGAPLFTAYLRDITERKRTEDALRQSEERYELAMAASESGYWDWDVKSDRYFVSARANELAGNPPENTLTARDEYGSRERMHTDDWAKWEAARKALFAGTGERIAMECRYVVRGETRWHSMQGICKRDNTGHVTRWTGSQTDITERKLAEEGLRKSEERYELAMVASESGYWDWDIPTGRYFISARANELVGLPRKDTIAGRGDFNVRIPVHPEDWAKWEAARSELFAGTGERLAMELRYIVSGATRWHSLQAICKRDETGKVVRWTGSATDVTERKLAEEALRQSEGKLRQAQRLEAMGTLAGGIAHDFNNILGAILGYGEMAQRDAPKGSRLARDLDSIMVAGERGRALVDRVLAFSRSAVGERVPVHVERVVREALDLVLAKLPPSATLHAKLHAGSSAVLGDATQIHQLVVNLATNAVQSMPGGGTLRVGLATMQFEAPKAAIIGGLKPGEYVVLTVADTGAGIAPEILDHIFDPFFTTKEVGTGTGLGLSLVHGIVTELGGGIDVVSNAGAGSTFTVYLPRSGDAPDAKDDAEQELPRGDGQRVLVVDDEEPLVRLATRTLEDLGYTPVGFTSSSAALAAFRAEPERFDALITDERMPGLSGSALIREVRGIRSSIPVALMSGYVGAAASEADEILQKPLSARDLATSLAKLLRSVVGQSTHP